MGLNKSSYLGLNKKETLFKSPDPLPWQALSSLFFLVRCTPVSLPLQGCTSLPLAGTLTEYEEAHLVHCQVLPLFSITCEGWMLAEGLGFATLPLHGWLRTMLRVAVGSVCCA